MRKNINEKFQKMLVGFASGVMIAASVWSLIIPSIELTQDKEIFSWIPASIGMFLGVLFLILINRVTDKLEKDDTDKSFNMLMFSVTLHNIPEGMAVGVCFVGFLSGSAGITLLEAMVLAIGIAVQNIPEGAIISMPMKMKGESRKKSFFYGVLSGVVEPISALTTIVLINFINPILPYLLSFAAGAMVYVVVEELVPEMQSGNKSKLGVIGVAFGFIIMMALDVTLG
ncbi:MAG: ZIP family metal transporter [Clostridia bacterium]|nr:ZIP family metal transporter [Clostridia bacterium]